MPFKSEAQRRKFHAMAGRGEMSQETVKKWEDETPKKLKKKLPYHVKKASPLVLAKLAVASNAFDFSQFGKAKLGMDSGMITSFLDELESIEKSANSLTNAGTKVIRAARQEVKAVAPAMKSGVTQAIPLRRAPRVGGTVGPMHELGSAHPANIAHAAQGGTNAGVVPQSLGGGGGGMTKTHVRAATPAAGPSNLRRNLAIGGAVGSAAMLGHMMPQHQQHQQQSF